MRSSSFVHWSPLLAVFAGGVSCSSTPLAARQHHRAYSDGAPVHRERANFTLSELWGLQVRFWDNFVYNNTNQSTSINSTLLAPDILGRVDATRTFEGQELNTEYIFGLFANIATANHGANITTILGVPVSYEMIHFAANQDISSAATVVFFNNTLLGTFPVEIDTWITWNAGGQVRQYDATFRWFANLLDLAVAAVATTAGPRGSSQERLATALAESVCETAQRYCTGARNAQYASMDDCRATLTERKRFGKAYELGGDTLLCRMVHANMVHLRPNVHCPHIGPSGGDMCVDDIAYTQRVLQPYFKHAPMVPEGYESGNVNVDSW